MVTKSQKTHRNKQTFITGNIGVAPWNGQVQNHAGDTTYKTQINPNNIMTKKQLKCIGTCILERYQQFEMYIKIQKRRTKTYYRQKLWEGCEYRHLGFKPGYGAPNPTLIPSSSYKIKPYLRFVQEFTEYHIAGCNL